tara:strand:+ start:76 stop:261 length:186 start_codon:yes stop_codon:yes gene_type:complete
MADLETMIAMLENSQISFELTEFSGRQGTELLIAEGYVGFYTSLNFSNDDGRLLYIETGER